MDSRTRQETILHLNPEEPIKVITELGKYVTVARRRGDNWFVASMSDSNARSYKLPLDFLRAGVTYNGSIYGDLPGKLVTSHARQAVSSTSIIPIDMESNGGHLMIIEMAGGRSSAAGDKEAAR